jgi:hypothetical protein
MSRLQTEFSRLFHPNPATPGLVDAQGRVRALVLGLAGPADWALLGAVWRGVQAELGLPAPAIAAAGEDGLQLWFSLAEPVAVEAAQAFLDLLRRRHLPEVAPQRLRLWPSATSPMRHAAPVPAPLGDSGNWSAFLAPDLAPLFAETPWLDLPPGDEGQAALLAPLNPIGASAFRAVIEPAAAVASTAAPARAADPVAADPRSIHPPGTDPAAHAADDPRRFLLAVMNDAAAPLALRIEAAKALLQHPPSPHTPEPRP